MPEFSTEKEKTSSFIALMNWGPKSPNCRRLDSISRCPSQNIKDSNAEFINPDPEIKQEDIISTSDVLFGAILKSVVAILILVHRIEHTSSPL